MNVLILTQVYSNKFHYIKCISRTIHVVVVIQNEDFETEDIKY